MESAMVVRGHDTISSQRKGGREARDVAEMGKQRSKGGCAIAAWTDSVNTTGIRCKRREKSRKEDAPKLTVQRRVRSERIWRECVEDSSYSWRVLEPGILDWRLDYWWQALVATVSESEGCLALYP